MQVGLLPLPPLMPCTVLALPVPSNLALIKMPRVLLASAQQLETVLLLEHLLLAMPPLVCSLQPEQLRVCLAQLELPTLHPLQPIAELASVLQVLDLPLVLPLPALPVPVPSPDALLAPVAPLARTTTGLPPIVTPLPLFVPLERHDRA